MKKKAFMGPGTYSTASPTMSTASFRTMPRMAKGGIIKKKTLLVDARTKKPYALAGEKGPEAVVPLKKESGMHSVIKLATAYIREYPLTSLAQSAELIEKIGEVYKAAGKIKLPPIGRGMPTYPERATKVLSGPWTSRSGPDHERALRLGTERLNNLLQKNKLRDTHAGNVVSGASSWDRPRPSPTIKTSQELPRMSAERFGQKFNPALVKGTKIQASANAAARRQAHTPVTTATAPLPRFSPSPIRMSRVPLGIGQSPMMRKVMKGRAVVAARSKAHGTPTVKTPAQTPIGPIAAK